MLTSIRALAAGLVVSLIVGSTYSAQEPARVNFARDVQPIFRQSCVGCHGPAVHQNGLRLDRRSDAMRGGTIADIGPGNSEGSRLYLRLIGNDYGVQMPPTGALKPEQIAVIKTWIDQGAEWPDEVANEAPPAPVDPAITRLLDTALWDTPAEVRRLLDQGADPDGRNGAGVTPLMRAVDSVEATRLLLEYGADPNAKSEEDRTPLIIAAGRFGSAPIVKVLLEYGANPRATAPGLGGRTSPLMEAAYHGDAAAMRLLLAAGAPAKDTGAVVLALFSHCAECFDLLAPAMDPKTLGEAAFALVPPDDDALNAGMLLARGADLSTPDSAGRTLLMRASASDRLPVDLVTALIAHGADVNVQSATGESALGMASKRGRTQVVDILARAGARAVPTAVADAAPPAPAHTAAEAIARSLPLMQRNDVTFLKKSGCVSCHNNTLTAMAVSAARAHRLPVDDAIARSQLRAIGSYLDGWRERALQGSGIPGDADTTSYLLLGLGAERYAPDETTAAMARFLLHQQTPEGQWRIVAHRPPIESSDFEVTAVSMRALQNYAPPRRRAEYDAAVRKAADWLRRQAPASTEDRAFQLFGLAWAGSGKDAIAGAGRALVAEQRADGGWAPLPTLDSDAYATGQSLAALVQSGFLTPASEPFTRGVAFLLKTQLADGSWFVRSRAIAIQPHFESGFPHGRDQFISAAATGWATVALAAAAR